MIAGRIWSEKAVDTGRWNGQVQVVDGELYSEAASQPVRFNQEVLHSHWRINADGPDLLTRELGICSAKP